MQKDIINWQDLVPLYFNDTTCTCLLVFIEMNVNIIILINSIFLLSYTMLTNCFIKCS